MTEYTDGFRNRLKSEPSSQIEPDSGDWYDRLSDNGLQRRAKRLIKSDKRRSWINAQAYNAPGEISTAQTYTPSHGLAKAIVSLVLNGAAEISTDRFCETARNVL